MRREALASWLVAAATLLLVLGLAFADGLAGRASIDGGGFMPYEDALYAGPAGPPAPPSPVVIEDTSPERVQQPFDHVALDTMRAGRLPLWMPYGGFGVPLLANGQSAPFNPLKLLLAGEAVGVPQAWFLVSRLALAGAGALVLARQLGLSAPAGLLAAIAFAFSGGFLATFNLVYTTSVAALPWLIWAGRALVLAPGWRRAGLLGLVIGLTGHLGHPETALVGAAAGVVVTLVELAARRGALAAVGGQLAGAIALGAGLAAVIIAPFAEYVRHATSYLFIPDSPIAHRLGTLFGFQASLAGLGRHLFDPAGGLDAYYVNPYAGGVALALAGWGLGHLATRRVALTLLACEAVAQLFWPPASPFWHPGFLPKSFYAVSLVPLALAVLAGAGLDRLMAADRHRRLQAAAVACVWAGAAAGLQLASQNASAVGPPFEATAFAIATFTVALLLAASAGGTRVGALLALVPLVAGGEAIAASYRTVPRLAPFTFTPPPVVRFLQHQPGPFRVATTGQVLLPSTSAFYGLESLLVTDAFFPRRYIYYMAALGRDQLDDVVSTRLIATMRRDVRLDLLDLANVRYVMLPEGARGLRLRSLLAAEPGRYPVVARQPGVEVREVKSAMPRAWVAYAADYLAPDLPTAARRLAGAEGRWRRRALLETATPPAGWRDADLPPGKAVVSERAPGETVVLTAPVRPGWLVLADQDYPGWTATVDGRPAPIVTADVAFRAVYLAAGPHTVVFRLQPATVTAGGAISLASLALCLLLLLAPRRQVAAVVDDAVKMAGA